MSEVHYHPQLESEFESVAGEYLLSLLDVPVGSRPGKYEFGVVLADGGKRFAPAGGTDE